LPELWQRVECYSFFVDTVYIRLYGVCNSRMQYRQIQ